MPARAPMTASDYARILLRAYVQVRREVAALRPEERESAEVFGFGLLEDARLSERYPPGVSAYDVAVRVVVLAERTHGPAFVAWIGAVAERFAGASSEAMSSSRKSGPREVVVTARRGTNGEWTEHPDAVREAIASEEAAREPSSPR
jgi:hypothetical protein